MSIPNPKELKKLVKTCRELGVSSFKTAEFEFTLGEIPKSKTRKSNKKGPEVDPEMFEIESDEPTQEQLLMWSVGDQ